MFRYKVNMLDLIMFRYKVDVGLYYVQIQVNMLDLIMFRYKVDVGLDYVQIYSEHVGSFES